MKANELPDRLEQHLSTHTPEVRVEWDARLAAVLIPLFTADDDWQVLFTRRTEHLDSHQGQVSFPGGVVEAQDANPQETALRETEEEIGIPAGKISILGTLDSLLTVTQFQIVPSVGLIPWPMELKINRMEVARVFSVPLAWLADKNNLEVRKRQFPLSDRPIDVYYFKPFEGEVIWGATARLTLNFLDQLKAAGII
ncbi:MAG: CoA pyrophosphatase [Anaerolineales bacterium]